MTGRRLAGWVVAVWVAFGPAGAVAASWGGINPGTTTRADVLAQYGLPSREATIVQEGRSVAELTYAGDRAPRGADRMVVSFGLIRSGQFDPDVVRALTLYPRPRLFTASDIAVGWGTPDAIGIDEQTKRSVLRYATKGLFVVMDATNTWAEEMVFAPAAGTP